jgi:hypothetical protein
MRSGYALKILAVIAGSAMFAHVVIAADLTPFLQTKAQTQPRTDLGLNFVADALNLRGVITTERIGSATLVAPRLASNLTLNSTFNLETRATFSNWNDSFAAPNSVVETSLTARQVLPLVSEVQGLMRRDADGTEHRKLRLKMSDATIPSFLFESIKLKTNATLEQVGVGDAQHSLLTSVEAALVQQAPSSSASNRVVFKYATGTGAMDYSRQAAIFSRSWTEYNVLRLAMEYQLTHEAGSIQNAVKLSWQGFF